MASQGLLFPEPAQLDVELDDTEIGGHTPGAPWNPNDIRVTTKPFSLRHIVDMIYEKELDLAPDFQRRTIWRGPQKSRLIESILLRIPLPAFYFDEDDKGNMQVVDGVQRLTAIYEFARGSLPDTAPKDDRKLILEGLQYLRDMEGAGYEQIESALRRRFDNTQIFVNVIDPQTPAALKFDIFQRINTGGSPLNSQEIRHCISTKVSRQFLKRCADLQSFYDATAGKLKDHDRMADRELALRFFAFRQADWQATYSGGKNWDDFLLTSTKRIDASAPAVLDRIASDFDKAMCHAFGLFDKNAFRKWPSDKPLGPINKSLFESWAVAFAEIDLAETLPRREAIVREARRRMAEDTEYIESFTMATSDLKRIQKRLAVAREILLKAGQ